MKSTFVVHEVSLRIWERDPSILFFIFTKWSCFL